MTPLRESQHTYYQNIDHISNSHDYLQHDLSRDLKNEGNYSQPTNMLMIRGVLIFIMDLNIPPNKPYSNQLQDVINTTSHPLATIYSSGNKIEYKR